MADFLVKAAVYWIGCNAVLRVRERLGNAKSFFSFVVISYLFHKNKTLFRLFTRKFAESHVDRVASVALTVPPVRQEYSKHLNEVLRVDRPKLLNHWKAFGTLHTSIPEKGLPLCHLKAFVNNLDVTIRRKLQTTHYSGSIYSFSYWNDSTAMKIEEKESDAPVNHALNKPEAFDKLAHNLSDLYTTAFQHSYLWNSLHEGEFGVGYWLQYQVVRMVADLYGGKPGEVMGFVTSGGTESLTTAIKLYREWGYVNRNHDIGQGVVLCAKSIHAAVNKAGMTLNVKVKMIPVDSMGRLDLIALKEAVARIGSDLICIVGSTPSYSLGVIDPIKDIAEIARGAGVGMHVDSCLGGFIINFLDNIDTDYLKIPGVTSISCDTHKNGWAPKGSSVIVTSKIPDVVHPPAVNLAFYGAYSIPDWDGGIYGTPTFPGSAAVAHVLHAYLAMLHIGKEGYKQIAETVHSTVERLAEVIKADDRLQLLGDHPANVIAWRIKPEAGWGTGAVYALAHEMSKRNMVLSALKHERLHYCVTGRSAAETRFVDDFAKALKESLDTTEKYAQDVKAGKLSFPGDAGLYGTLEAAMEPSSENTKSTAEYYGNLLLGKRVVVDSIKAHFFGLQDPFVEQNL